LAPAVDARRHMRRERWASTNVLDAAKASCPRVKAFLAKSCAYGEMEQQIRAALPKREL
jgi:hypothetical protein